MGAQYATQTAPLARPNINPLTKSILRNLDYICYSFITILFFFGDFL
jgi:hypothetical protein